MMKAAMVVSRLPLSTPMARRSVAWRFFQGVEALGELFEGLLEFEFRLRYSIHKIQFLSRQSVGC